MWNSVWNGYLQSHKTLKVWAGGIGFVMLCGAAAVFAQATLPEPEILAADTTAAAAPGPAQPALPQTLPPPAPVNQAPNPEEAKARAAALAAKANIDVTGAWTRATPGNATTAAVYLHIVSAKDPDKLLSAEAAYADHIEMHDETMQNGVMKMTPIQTLEIPAGATVDFAPGGKHFMLVGLKAPLKEGESFLMTLKFDKAGTETTPVKILSATATGLPAINTARAGDTTADVSKR